MGFRRTLQTPRRNQRRSQTRNQSPSRGAIVLVQQRKNILAIRPLRLARRTRLGKNWKTGVRPVTFAIFNRVNWVHEDPVTKSKRVTDGLGNVVSATELDPWGRDTNRSSNAAFQPKQFTSYERDANGSDEAIRQKPKLGQACDFCDLQRSQLSPRRSSDQEQAGDGLVRQHRKHG
jgi:hypothetical protein